MAERSNPTQALGRVWIVGASGLIGGELVKRMRELNVPVLGTARTVRGHAEQVVDLQNPDQIRSALAGFQPDTIVICSAWPHVDGCQTDPERSLRENVQTIENLLGAITNLSIRVLFYSTDHVFDGSKVEAIESDPVNPLSVYAQHKRQVEERLGQRPHSTVVRTSWVFGPELGKKNFVYRVIGASRAGQKLLVPEGQSGCPTSTVWLVDRTLKLIASGLDGVIHLSGSECLTKAEWARCIQEELDLTRSPIEEVSASESGQIAPRPSRIVLKSERHLWKQPSVKGILKQLRSEFLS